MGGGELRLLATASGDPTRADAATSKTTWRSPAPQTLLLPRLCPAPRSLCRRASHLCPAREAKRSHGAGAGTPPLPPRRRSSGPTSAALRAARPLSAGPAGEAPGGRRGAAYLARRRPRFPRRRTRRPATAASLPARRGWLRRSLARPPARGLLLPRAPSAVFAAAPSSEGEEKEEKGGGRGTSGVAGGGGGGGGGGRAGGRSEEGTVAGERARAGLAQPGAGRSGEWGMPLRRQPRSPRALRDGDGSPVLPNARVGTREWAGRPQRGEGHSPAASSSAPGWQADRRDPETPAFPSLTRGAPPAVAKESPLARIRGGGQIIGSPPFIQHPRWVGSRHRRSPSKS